MPNDQAHESFGSWLRERRKALDLTQAAVAHCVGCAEVTIRKLEAGVQRPSRQTAERLATCLQILAEEHDLFLQVARGERGPDRLPPTRPPRFASRRASTQVAIEPLPLDWVPPPVPLTPPREAETARRPGP